MKNIRFARKVRVEAESGRVVYWVHAALAAHLIVTKRAQLAPALNKKAQKGKGVYVDFIQLTKSKFGLDSESLRARHTNSSKTTFEDRFGVIRKNERGENGRTLTRAIVHSHKTIDRKSVGLYGLRVGVVTNVPA